MAKGGFFGFAGGCIGAVSQFMGDGLLLTVCKGFLGGLIGYLGKEFATWGLKKLKTVISKKLKTKNKK